MSDNKESSDAQVLHWPGKLFSAEDLQRHLKGQRELVLLNRALLTPLALDELRARGVRVTRQDRAAIPQAGGMRWGYMAEQVDPAVVAAVAALEREGLVLTHLQAGGNSLVAWLRSAREWHQKNGASVWFCRNAALACCLVNKVTGVRAAAVVNALQTSRALTTLGANLLVVEMPGRTFFEVRQILRAAATGAPACPADVANILGELENHAHR